MARSLVERLAELTDPRDRRGRQYPMVGLLTLCLVAVLAGHTGPEAIAQFGRLRQKRRGHALGFKNGNMPCANTIAALLRGLDAADAEMLLGYTRGHWCVENGLHHTRDVTLDEDRCRVRRGRAPRVLASLRNVAVYLLRHADYPSAAAASRAMGAKPELALAFLNDPNSISA